MPTCSRRNRASASSSMRLRSLARDHDLPPVGALETGEHHQQGGLARARRSDQPDRLAGRDVEIDAAQDVDRPRRGRHGQVQVPDLHQRNLRRRSGIHGGTIWRPRPVAGSHDRTGPDTAADRQRDADPAAGAGGLALRRIRPGARPGLRGAARRRPCAPVATTCRSSMAPSPATPRPADWHGSTGRWPMAPMRRSSSWGRMMGCAASIRRETERNLTAILDRLAARHLPVLLTGMYALPNLGAGLREGVPRRVRPARAAARRTVRSVLPGGCGDGACAEPAGRHTSERRGREAHRHAAAAAGRERLLAEVPPA